MADPKIKYDIEAAVNGASDVDELAQAVRGVGDVLEGDLQQSAKDAAAALEALGSKQRALSTFSDLKLEAGQLGTAFDGAVKKVNALGDELQQASTKTQSMAAAEKTASAAVADAQAKLQSKRDALKAVREETTNAAKRGDEYRTTVNGLKEGIAGATKEVKDHQAAQRTAAQASTTAQNAEAALRKEYDLSIASAAKVSSELRAKNTAVATATEALQSFGLSTRGVAQQEKDLQAAVAKARAEVVAMVPAYQQAAAASSQSTQVQAQNQRTLREGMTSISTQLQRIQQIATIAVGGGYFGGLIKDVAATADEFKNLEARVKLATGEGPGFQRSFDGVKRVALDTNSALDETGTLFARIAKASQEGGMAAEAAQNRALGLTQTINQSIQLSGGSAEAAKAAITQLIQGLQSGVLRGEEFNSVMEQAPRLAQALAAGLGVTTGELRKMAEQGALTSEVVMKSLEGQADVVAGEFAKLPATVGRALQNLSTQWTLYVGSADAGLISSANAAKVIDALAKNLDLVVSTLTSAGKLWGAMKVAGLVADFARWATTTLTATAAIEANTVATTSNTVAQRANAAAQAEGALAQAANTTATNANSAAKAANASAWAKIGEFTKAATSAQVSATAATAAGTATAVSKTSVLTSLGKAIGGVTRLLGGPVGLVLNLVLFREELSRGTRAVTDWVFSFTPVGRELKAAEKALKDHETALQLNTEAAKIAADSEKRLADRQAELRDRSYDLTKQSTGLIAEFDKLTKAGDSTAEALGKIGKDFDVSNSAGIRAMSAALDKLLADGKITASEFQGAWAKALDGQDLAKFEVLARNAFAAAGQEADKLRIQIEQSIQKGASPEVVNGLRQRLEAALSAATREGERVATMMDNVLRAAVQRTGLDFTELQGRINEASRSAINDLDAIAAGMGRLKEQGVDAGRVLETSFVKAINTASSQQAIDAVRTRVEQLRTVLGSKVADGLLDQAKTKALEIADAMDKARPNVNSVREAMQQLGITTDATLTATASKAKEAYDFMASSGKASARELGEGFKQAAEAAIAANKGIAPSWVVAQAGVRGYQLDVDAAGRATVRSMEDARKSTSAVGTAAREVGSSFADMGRQAELVLRQMGIQADTVSQKVQLLVQQGQLLAAGFQQRQDNWNKDLQNSSFMNRGTTNPVDQVPTFNSRAEAEAWKAEWLRQYQRDNPFAVKSGGQLGNFMKDLTMFEYQKELDALAVREAMEAARKKAEGSTGGGGTGGGTGGTGGTVDRVVNIYIGNSVAYSVPTNQTGQQSIEALAREVIRYLEQQKAQLGY